MERFPGDALRIGHPVLVRLRIAAVGADFFQDRRISLAQLREWTGHASINAVRGYVRETEVQVAEQVMEVFRLTNMDRMPEAWR